MEQSKKKKIITSILGILVVIIALVGVTYAFFNYTRTGVANTISVGRIALSVGRIAFVTRQTETINLTDLFPIDPTETGIMDDATKVGTLEIEIEGDTDYNGGVEYLISTVNSNVTTSSGKTIPISLNVEVTDLGNSSDTELARIESGEREIPNPKTLRKISKVNSNYNVYV